MELKTGLQAIRNSVETRMPPDSLRQDLLRQFAQASRSRFRRRMTAWTLAAAAALVCCFFVWHSRPVAQEQASLQMPLEDGFQAVPYAPSLAEGEVARLVHTELAPGTLTRLGVFVGDASGDSIPVDLIVGQDDAPLAVRVDEEENNKETSE